MKKSIPRRRSSFINVEDARQAASRVLPRAVFDFVDGGALDELTVRDNRRAFEEIWFRPRVAVHVESVDTRSSVAGSHLSAPIVFAPCGLMGVVHPDAESAVARVAERVGTAAAFSTYASTSLSQIGSAAGGDKWFQLYFLGGRRGAEELIGRAQDSGFSTLVVTVDTSIAGRRERDERNGVVLPLRVGLRSARTFGPQVLLRPAWLYRFARAGFPLEVANASLVPHDPSSVQGGAQSLFDETPTWADFEWIRSMWSGPMVVKGILRGEDAARAVDSGAQAVVVSNHGGRQLDGAPSALRVLPEVVEAVGGRCDVMVDGGVRRGGDVAKALALGANAVMIGRPYLWGLAAGGEPGVQRIWELLVDELVSTMKLLGCGAVGDLGPGHIIQTGPGGERGRR